MTAQSAFAAVSENLFMAAMKSERPRLSAVVTAKPSAFRAAAIVSASRFGLASLPTAAYSEFSMTNAARRPRDVAAAGAAGGSAGPATGDGGTAATATDGGGLFTPEVQHPLLRAFGTLPFSQHFALGPCTPGLTEVQAWHSASWSQACRHRFGSAAEQS